MDYQVLVLDLDGTLTNSKKEITGPTKEALIDIQRQGKILVLASGRPINGVAPLAGELLMGEYGGYMLSFNGARITRCSTQEVIYDRALPKEVIRPIYETVCGYPGLDIITYHGNEIISGIMPNEYTKKEAAINHMSILCPEDYPAVNTSAAENGFSDSGGLSGGTGFSGADGSSVRADFPDMISFPANKLLIPGEPAVLEELMPRLKEQYHGLLNIYRSEPFFLEIMPQNIDKAYSLQKLLNSLGLTADSMICCGDGYNDVSMIEYAGLGVAMENAQTVVKESADFVTRSNDEDGILHVINLFMR